MKRGEVSIVVKGITIVMLGGYLDYPNIIEG